jgi:uncharacterized membrane protein
MSLSRALSAWPVVVNLALVAFIGGAVLAPVLAAAGYEVAARGLYSLYHVTCHQWAFRSFFLFGKQAVFGQEQLTGMGVDPYTFTGSPETGWKMACCERDLAIYLGLLGVGLWFSRRRTLPRMSLWVCVLLALPMAVDGVTQLFGWRESTWELRLLTGLLFGIASAWFLLPRLDGGLLGQRRYAAAETACVRAQPNG